MQGAFPGGVDWAAALDPGVDEATQVVQQSDKLERELQQLVRQRDRARAPPAPAAPGPLQYTEVFPPTAHFKYEDKTYFLLKSPGNRQAEARPGILCHYLVPTVDIPTQAGYCRPLAVKIELPQQDRVVVPNANIPTPPGYALNDVRLRPSNAYCLPFRDYIVPAQGRTPNYYEIGLDMLQGRLESAESLDLAFARRMEGLGFVSAQVCWDCLDPDYDPSDRPAVMDQFMGKYLGRFYDRIDPDGGPATEQVVGEAVRKHKAFCQAWVRKHYKTLTPAVTAPAEALASEFFPYIEAWIPVGVQLTRMEFARILMRLPETSADFASCLHYYTTSLEQARGGRNASYKQMTVVTTYRAASHRRFGDLLASKASVLRGVFARLANGLHDRHFDVLVVDWHTILGQMPQVHKLFQNTGIVQGLLKVARRHGANDAAHVPPWRTMRNTGA